MIGKWTINLDRCLLLSFYSWRTSDCEDDSDYEGLILFVRMEKRRSRQNYEDQISIDREKMEFSHCAWIEFENCEKMIPFSVDGIIGKEDKSRRKKRNACDPGINRMNQG